ncbi:hypothetical protein Y032_0151g2800 [Ancylostoma ceylanicum]|uniref:Uncharacterized protein n=1 Tax=Ancylostoma ceylanicum TaxID=53326 RepID=A0A016T0R7_9BILA|nr:hypothetical protein Y032_0151g2800 [Ancylostoma ceylanicum]
MLLLVMKHEKSEKVTKSGRKAPRNSTLTADDNDFGASGAVARRPCEAVDGSSPSTRTVCDEIQIHC